MYAYCINQYYTLPLPRVHRLLSELQSLCVAKGLVIIKAQFILTEKNQPFSEFLGRTQWFADHENNTYNYSVKSTFQLLVAENEA